MTRATGLTVSVGLVEDHWPVTRPRLSPAADHFAVIDRGAEGAVELIGLDARGRLVQLTHDPASPSGWRADIVPFDRPVHAEIAGLTSFVEEGVLQVLVHFSEVSNDSVDLVGTTFVVWLQSSGGGRWSELELEPELAAALSSVESTQVHVDEAGRHFVYGRSRLRGEAAFFLAARASSGAWELASSARCVSPSVVHAVVGSPEGHALTVLSIEARRVTFHGALFHDGLLEWAPGPVRSIELAGAPEDLERVIELPSQTCAGTLLLASRDGALYVASGWSRGAVAPQSMTGGPGQPSAALQVALGLDGTGRSMMYVLDAGHHLWLARQHACDADGVLTFAPWVALGHKLSAIACPRVTDLGPELYALDGEGQGLHLTQRLGYAEHGGGTWRTTPIYCAAEPGTPAIEVSVFSADVALSDEGGHPVGATEVEVTSGRPVVVAIDGVAHRIDPLRPARIVTDRTGRLSLSMLATQLSSPALGLHVPGAMDHHAVRTIRLDATTHARLAGQDPAFAVNGGALRAAGLVPAQLGPATANAIATVVRSLAQLVLAMGRTPSSSSEAWLRVELPRVRIDFAGTSLVVETLTNREADAYFLEATAIDAGRLPSAFGDAASMLVSGAARLDVLVIDAEEDRVRVAFGAEGGARSFHLQNPDEVAEVLELLLARVSRGADRLAVGARAAAWARLTLDWEQLLGTTRVLAHYLDGALVNLSVSSGTELAAQIRGRLRALALELDTSLARLAEHQGSVTLAELARGPRDVAPPELAADERARASRQDAATRRIFSAARVYFATRAPEGLRGQLTGEGVADDASARAFEALVDTVESCLATDQIQDALERLQGSLQALVAEPHDIYNVGLAELASAVRETIAAVLVAADELVEPLLHALNAACWQLRATLDAPLEIPGLSSQYERASGGDPLKLLDLVCLLLASRAVVHRPSSPSASAQAALMSTVEIDAVTREPVDWPSLGYEGRLVLTRPKRRRSRVELAPDARAWLIASTRFAAADLEPLLDHLGHSQELFDGARVPASPLEGLLSWVSIAGRGLAMTLDMPERELEQLPSQRQRGDELVIAAWLAGLAPLAADVAYTALGPRAAAARATDLLGQLLAGATGALVLALELTLAAENPQRDETFARRRIAEGVLGALPGVSKFLLVPCTDRAYRTVAGLSAACHAASAVIHLRAAEELSLASTGAGEDDPRTPVPRSLWQGAIRQLSAFGA